jgi:hypothetical protein
MPAMAAAVLSKSACFRFRPTARIYRRLSRDRVYLLKARIKGRQRILTIGRHGRGACGPETARREAERQLGLIRNGKDLAAERNFDRKSLTLSALAARYLVEYADPHKKSRTRAENSRLLKLHILTAL